MLTHRMLVTCVKNVYNILRNTFSRKIKEKERIYTSYSSIYKLIIICKCHLHTPVAIVKLHQQVVRMRTIDKGVKNTSVKNSSAEN